MPANEIDQLLRLCYLYRGSLLQISPSDPTSELVAKKMLKLYGGSIAYAGWWDLNSCLSVSR